MVEHQKELLTIDDFAKICSLSLSGVYTQIRKKAIRVTKIGRRTYIKRADLEAWVAAQELED